MNIFLRNFFLYGIAFYCGCFSATAQSYQFFPNNARAVYSLNDPDNCFGGYCLKGYRVDFIVGNTNYTYREAKPENNLNGNCLINTQAIPWLGERVVYTSNGLNLIINAQQDTLRTFIHPSNGTSWVFHNLGNGEFIRATQESQYFKQYIGKHDDTKRIRLHRMNTAGDTLPSPWNGRAIEYSFNFSIYNFPNANTFPEDTNMYYIYGLNRLIPGTSASMDTLIPDAPDFFTYLNGQEWHYLIEQRHENMQGEILHTKQKQKKFLMDSELSADSSSITLTYWQVDVIWEETGFPPDANTAFTTITDTIIRKINFSDYDYLNRMPDEFYPTGHYGPGYVRWFAEGDWNGRVQKRFHEGWEYDESNNCLAPSLLVDGNIERIFVDKIGLVFAEIPGEDAEKDFYKKELIYFQRGLEEWGGAFDFQQYFEIVSVGEQAINREYIVYPNPAQNIFTVQFASPVSATFHIMDISGKILLETQNNNTSKQQFDISEFPAGMYFLEFTTKEGDKGRHKIIKL